MMRRIGLDCGSRGRGGEAVASGRSTLDRARRGWGWVELVTDLGRLFAPAQCPGCHRRVAGGARFCRGCARRVSRARRREQAVRPSVPVGGGCRAPVWAVAPLEGPWGRAVRSFKEDPDPKLGRLLAGPLVARVREDGGAPDAVGESGEGSGPVLVPVPMAAVRRRERGHNPAEELARALAAWLGRGERERIAGPPPEAPQPRPAAPLCPARVEASRLRRWRYRRPLRRLSARERRQEVAGAFVAASPPAGAPERIWLVDDVYTTGATLGAAASELTAAGYDVLGALVLARTPRRRRVVSESGSEGTGRPVP